MLLRRISQTKLLLLAPDRGDTMGSAVATVETVPMASNLERLEERTHSQSSAFLDRPKVKLTSEGTSIEPDQVEYLLVHFRNPPLMDGLMTVNTVFHMIEDKVISYQLDHNDAFYSQNQKLLKLVLSASEDMSNWSDEYIRINHREFSRRLAHWFWQFCNYSTMYLASCVNLCLWGHVKGKGKMHDTGEAMKLGRVNNALTRLGAYFLPKGRVQYFADNSKYGVGQVVSNAFAFSVPYWNTAMYGSPSRVTTNLSDNIVGAKFVDDVTGYAVDKADSSSKDYQYFMSLARNMDRVKADFVRDDITADAQSNLHHVNYIMDQLDTTATKDVNVGASTPYIENGQVLTLDSGDEVSMNLGCNGSLLYESQTRQKVGDGSYVTTDNLINRIWDTFDFYLESMEEYFVEMSNQTSPVVEFFKSLGLLEDPVSSSKLWNMFDTSNTVTLDSLRDQMIYKKGNRAKASSEIKWAPIFDDYTHSWKDDDFDNNFNRYKVDLDDDYEIVREASKWPSNNPMIFHEAINGDDGSIEPFVMNSDQSGSIICKSTRTERPVKGMMGKYLSILDYMSSSVFDYLQTAVSCIGTSPDTVKEFLDRGDGTVYRETLDCVHNLWYPLVDNSDPYQCGFYLVVYANSTERTEHEQFYMNPDRIKVSVNAKNTSPIAFDVDSNAPSLALNAAVGWVTPETYKIPHVANPDYLERQRYCFIFLGDSIWFHPEAVGFLSASGNPTEYIAEIYDADPDAHQELHDLIDDVTTFCYTASSNSKTPGSIDVDSSTLTMDQFVAAGLLGDSCIAKKSIYPGLAFSTLTYGLFAFTNVPNTVEVMQTMFNPSYGPITPIIYDMPNIGQSGMAQQTRAVSQDNNSRVESDDIVSGIKVTGSELNADDTTWNNYHILTNCAMWASYDSLRTVAQSYLWFIDNMIVKKIFRKGRRLYAPEKVVDLPGFSGIFKTVLALLARGRVEHLGSEDSKYLNNCNFNINDLEKYDYQSAPAVNFGSILLDAKVIGKEFKTRPAFARTGAKVSVTIETKSAQSDKSESGDTKYGKERKDVRSGTTSEGEGNEGNRSETKKGRNKRRNNKNRFQKREQVADTAERFSDEKASGFDDGKKGQASGPGEIFRKGLAKPERADAAMAAQSGAV